MISLPHKLLRSTLLLAPLVGASVFWAGCAGSRAGSADGAKTATPLSLREQIKKERAARGEADESAPAKTKTDESGAPKSAGGSSLRATIANQDPSEKAEEAQEAVITTGVDFVIPDVPTNDPTDINPLMRSWEFTSEKDYTVYRVIGERDYDQEVRMALGLSGDRHRYVVQRRLRGENVGEKEILEFPHNPEQSNVSLSRRLISKGYLSQTGWLGRGDKVFPTLKLTHPQAGEDTYSEDVPLGGLVSSVNNATGVSYRLLKYERAQDPPPSQLIVEKKEVAATAGIQGINQVRPQETAKEYEPQITDVDSWIREDADTVPNYFQPRGDPTTRLDKLGWILDLRFNLPQTIGTWAIEYTTEVDPEAESQEPTYSYELRTQHEGSPEKGKVKVSNKISNVSGTPPAEVVEGKSAKLFDLKAPLLPDVAHSVYHDKSGVKMKLGLTEYSALLFSIYEEPDVVRTELADGGEEQDIKRTLHRLWVDTTASGEPLLLRRETTVFSYRQRTNARALLVESSHKESLYRETLTNLWTPDNPELLDANRVPLE